MSRGKPADTIVITGSVDGINGNAPATAIPLNASDGPDNRDAAGTIVIEPSSLAGPDALGHGNNPGEPAPKRRGRKPGSTNRGSAQKAVSLDVSGVEKILYSMHNLLASVAQTPELALDKSESEELAKGITAVARHYDMGATQKTLDWSNLIGVIGMVYGTRLFAIRARVQEQRRKDMVEKSSLTSVLHTIPTGA